MASQFLLVNKANDDSESDVLIFGIKNGTTGNVLSLDGGEIEVSVDEPGAKTQIITLENTTIDNPMIVYIETEGDDEEKS